MNEIILPYEILTVIAMCGWGAYKALALADRRIWTILRKVNKCAHFTREYTWEESIGMRDYYMCYMSVKTHSNHSTVVNKGSLRRSTVYGWKILGDVCEIDYIARTLDCGHLRYKEHVWTDNNLSIRKVMREMYGHKALIVMESWDMTTGVIKRERNTGGGVLNHITTTVDESFRWSVVHPGFYLYRTINGV